MELYTADNVREAVASSVSEYDKHFSWFGGNKSCLDIVENGSFQLFFFKPL